MSTVELIAAKVRELPPDKQQEVLDFITTIEPEQAAAQPVHSMLGLWKGLGFDISAEEIDEARREMWGNFPRNDF